MVNFYWLSWCYVLMRLMSLLPLLVFAVGCAPLPTKISLSVPHKMQKKNLCVPTSTAMVLQYYGDDQDPEYIKGLAGWGDSNRTRYREIIAGLKAIGYNWKSKNFPTDAWGFKSGIAEIKRNLADSRPVLIDVSKGERGHTMVVAGYDETEKMIELVDPARPSESGFRVISYEELDSIWRDPYQNKNRYMMLTYPRK